MSALRVRALGLLAAASVVVVSCGGGSGNAPAAPPPPGSYTIGGSISGLSGYGLVLQDKAPITSPSPATHSRSPYRFSRVPPTR